MQLVFSHPVSASKGNEVPLQAWNLTEGSKKLKFPDFMTTAQDGGKVVSFYAPTAFTPGSVTNFHI